MLNNLRFVEFTEKTEGAETWEESENLIKKFTEKKSKNGNQGHNF